tara:strand:+ start:424 stop:1224 length:801 start_codon:yes stop_codon:yes gene_type:complete
MGVDGGAGNAISFSEIQTFYGGSNPISLSEYYQGGDEVPGTSSASGTTSQTVNNIAAVVSTIATGYTSFSTTITQGNSGYSGNQSSGNWNVIRENSSSGTGTWTARVLDASTTLSVSCDQKALTVTKNGSTVVTFGNSGGSDTVSCSPGDVIVWTCSAGAGGGGTINRSQSWAWSGSPTIQYTANTNGGTSGSVTGYTMTLTNNTGASIDLTSSPWGDDSTFTSGEVKTEIRSSNSFSFSAPGNTNVPTSGTININVFNAPGTPTP